MTTFKATLAYDGTGLIGWQRQASGTSIQGLIEAVLEELEPRSPKAKGQDPKRFFDDRFVRELQANGFIDALYR